MSATEHELADRAESWPVVESRDLHRDDFPIALRTDQVQRPGHEEDGSFRRLVVEHPGAVVVLAVDEQDRVCCLRQYRHPAQRSFVELPAGLCDIAGESPEGVARRELAEEADLQASEWTHLISTYSTPGIIAERIHYYLARGLSPSAPTGFVRTHEEAELEPFWVPFDELRAAVLDGRLEDAPLVIAVLTCAARGLVGGAPASGRL